MNGFILLGLAIAGEIFASSMLKESNGFTKFLPIVGMVIGYAISFWGLAVALESIDLGIAYAIWAGVGTAATTIIGILFYKEMISIPKITGILLIIVGVILLNL